jgi:hypothetical protein
MPGLERQRVEKDKQPFAQAPDQIRQRENADVARDAEGQVRAGAIHFDAV